MANVTVKWNRGGAYNGEITKLAKVDSRAMDEAGLWLATQVERRTQSGYDEAGNRFESYSEGYAREKNVSPTAVDLTRSGSMFASWGVLRSAVNYVKVGFGSKAMEQRARYNEQHGRRFLGIDPKWLKEIRRRLAKGIGFTSGAYQGRSGTRL